MTDTRGSRLRFRTFCVSATLIIMFLDHLEHDRAEGRGEVIDRLIDRDVPAKGEPVIRLHMEAYLGAPA